MAEEDSACPLQAYGRWVCLEEVDRMGQQSDKLSDDDNNRFGAAAEELFMVLIGAT